MGNRSSPNIVSGSCRHRRARPTLIAPEATYCHRDDRPPSAAAAGAVRGMAIEQLQEEVASAPKKCVRHPGSHWTPTGPGDDRNAPPGRASWPPAASLPAPAPSHRLLRAPSQPRRNGLAHRRGRFAFRQQRGMSGGPRRKSPGDRGVAGCIQCARRAQRAGPFCPLARRALASPRTADELSRGRQ